MTKTEQYPDRLIGLPRMPAPEDREIAVVEHGAERNKLADAVAAVLRNAIESLRKRDSHSGDPVAATQSAVGAIEGTLRAKSLEGELKQAEIERAYAERALKIAEIERLHAETALSRAQTEKLKVEMAWAQLANTLELFQKLGVTVQLTILPDGRPAVTVGDSAVMQFPETNLTGNREQERSGEAIPPDV